MERLDGGGRAVPFHLRGKQLTEEPKEHCANTCHRPDKVGKEKPLAGRRSTTAALFDAVSRSVNGHGGHEILLPL